MEQLEADVCVVGAGFAGLAAARYLQEEAKMKVVVLEAWDGVGGRVWGKKLKDGTEVSVGGTWLGKDQSRMFDLVGKVGLGVYPQYDDGEMLMQLGGKTTRYDGLMPEIGVWGLLSLGAAFAELNEMAATLPLDTPWLAPRAKEWDAQTLGAWISSIWNAPSENAQIMLRTSLGLLFSTDLSEVSLLGSLVLARGGGKDGFQYFADSSITETHLIDGGGAPEVARRLGERLGDSLRKNAPVRRISQENRHVVVSGDGVSVRASYVIVATPPLLASQIEYSPALPEAHGQLMRQMPPGNIIRGITVYERPFWRDRGPAGQSGLTGQTVGPDSPIPVTIDQSPRAPYADAPPPRGILSSYAFGRHAIELAKLDEEERREVWLGELAKRFDDPAAARPIVHDMTDWTAERWSLGGMISHFPPGVVTSYGSVLHEPYRRIYWAGSERATLMHGLMEGAVRSGEQAAQTIAQKLRLPEIPAV
jgi:monoamine oxidase